MKIREVNENKKQFISLLLLADEQESMVDRYLEKGIGKWKIDDRRVGRRNYMRSKHPIYRANG